jgi:hypothetical protein
MDDLVMLRCFSGIYQPLDVDLYRVQFFLGEAVEADADVAALKNEVNLFTHLFSISL